MDADRVQRLGGLVAMGVAMQVSSEALQTKSSAHSFWLIIAISLAMLVVQVLFQELLKLQGKIKGSDNENWIMWVQTLAQTVLGIETIVWTLYGSAIGQWVLRMYTDMFEIPTFFYFLPLYAFLFGYFSVNSSRVQVAAGAEVQETFNRVDVIKRLDRLEKRASFSNELKQAVRSKISSANDLVY